MSEPEDRPEGAEDSASPAAATEPAAASSAPPPKPAARPAAPPPKPAAATRNSGGFGTNFDTAGDPVPSMNGRAANLDVVLDIPITLSMELGRTRLSIRELLALSQGNVVRLDRPAGEPLDILVNGCLVARGEVVVVNDRFGVRIVEIVSPEERIKRLR